MHLNLNPLRTNVLHDICVLKCVHYFEGFGYEAGSWQWRNLVQHYCWNVKKTKAIIHFYFLIILPWLQNLNANLPGNKVSVAQSVSAFCC